LCRALAETPALFCRLGDGSVPRDDVLHLTRLERDIPSPASETACCVDRLHPFVQRVPLGLVLRTVGALDLEGEDRAASETDQEIRDVSPPGARPHVVDLKAQVIVLGV